MSDVTIRLLPAGKDEAETGRLAATWRRLLRDELPDAVVTAERTDPDAQDAGSLLVVAVSHVAVMSLLEVAKLYWDLHPGTAVKFQTPDGTTMSFRGAGPELLRTIQKVAGAAADRPT
jgi:hypothetical protein